MLTAFKEILTRLEDEEARSDISLKEYENPSWAYKQADKNGARRAYNKIRQLFTFD